MQINKPKTKNNTQNGITLIALVITIIVLLILAGVAINMAINSDGLFGKANEAAEGWNTAVEEERTAIQGLLDKLGVREPLDLPEGWEESKVADIVKETSTITGTNKERIAPIPVGFVASQITADAQGKGAENTIAGGLVIYQVPAGATVDWANSTITLSGEATAKNLQETVNQFVWIPVDDINQMVMCKSNNSTGTVTAENTSDVCNIELVNGTLKCTNKTHTRATELCGRLYGADTNTSTKPYTTSMDFSLRNQTWTNNSGYREPDVLGSSYDNESNTSGLSAFTTNMSQDFINMTTSVKKYGGFYVSRYEVGENGASKKNQRVITAGTALETPTVYQGVNRWYGLYNTVRTSSEINKTVKYNTHMIYGSQYDQIINFLESNSNNEPQKGHSDRQLPDQGLTGANGNDIMNNIYDLEGNNREWTAQASNTSGRVLRGGNYGSAYDGNYYPAASNRGYSSPTSTSRYDSSRTSLYL